MKKVVRLSENDLNRLIKKAINEAPFDYRDEPFDIDFFNNASESEAKKYYQDRMKKMNDQKAKYEDFEKNGLMMKPDDVTLLLSLSMNFCSKADMTQRYPQTKCPKLPRIKSYVDDIMSQNFSKY